MLMLGDGMPAILAHAGPPSRFFAAIGHSLAVLTQAVVGYRRRPVLPSRGPTFHGHAVRDALGLVRLLFAVEREETDIARAAALADIGKTLSECLTLATEMRDRPDTVGYRAAMHRSWDAVDKLAAMSWPAHVAELVRMAQSRVKGAQLKKDDARDLKRKAVAARG